MRKFAGRARRALSAPAALLLAVAVALSSSALAQAGELGEGVFRLAGRPAPDASFPVIETEVAEITDYGDLVLDVSRQDIFDASYLMADTVALEVGGARFIMPIVSVHYEGMPGCAELIAEEEGPARASIMYGRLAEAGGLAGIVQPGDAVRISMVCRGGYAAMLPLHDLVRTYQREDYSSDEAYANFRVVDATGLGAGALVRSSSPIDGQIARAGYAAALDEAAGVRCVLNLTNSPDEAARLVWGTWPVPTGYAQLLDEGLVCAIALDVHLGSDAFREGLAEELRFMAAHEGPYLVHCVEGKDRTGFTCLLLEALVGATYDELAADYLQTFVNFYHVEPDSRQYDVLQAEYVDRFLLRMIAGTGNRAALSEADLQASAAAYLRDLGLDDGEVAALKENLSRDYVI